LIVTERVTLITGASAGIGTELARVFASRGHRLALVARRGDRLTALGAEITAAGGAAPIVIPCDLVQPDCGDRIAEALAAAGVEVEYVVNNAGFGLFGKAVQRDRADQLDMIAVNIRALTELSLRFSVLSFTEAMRAELATHGVRVTVLCPGPVPSEFQARAGFRPGFDSMVLNVSPADVAQQAYRGLMANKRAVMPGIGIKIVPFLLRLFPRSFILGAVGRLQLRQR
jgi:short-subunit dehydrogenase